MRRIELVLLILPQVLWKVTAKLSFLSLGDWGKRTEHSEAVTRKMGEVAQEKEIDFVLLVGDNFYENGVNGTDDPLWQTTYQDLFTADALHVPFYVVRGNHDVHQAPDTEIEYYLQAKDDRWYFPSPYYAITKHFCAEETDSGLPPPEECQNPKVAEFIFLDAPYLSVKHTQAMNAKAKGKELSSIIPDDVEERKADQLAWLNKTLDTAIGKNPDWLFVINHYPMFSAGEHGDGEELIQEVKPLLEKYQVDAYICGHDHTLQHLEEDGVQYYVSGAGSMIGDLSNAKKTKATTVKAAKVDYGFMAHEIKGDELHTTAINADGMPLFEHVQKRKLPRIPPTIGQPPENSIAGGDRKIKKAADQWKLLEKPSRAFGILGLLFVSFVALIMWRRRRAARYRALDRRGGLRTEEFEEDDDEEEVVLELPHIRR